MAEEYLVPGNHIIIFHARMELKHTLTVHEKYSSIWIYSALNTCDYSQSELALVFVEKCKKQTSYIRISVKKSFKTTYRIIIRRL